jgi:hypothetical protein
MTMPPVIGQNTSSGFDTGANPPTTFGVWGDSGDGAGVIGSSSRPGAVSAAGATHGGAGVLGINDQFQGIGVQGRANADTGIGVLGFSERGTGVAGHSRGSGPGVAGVGTASPGVSGTSTNGPGVSGESTAGPGVRARSTNGNAIEATTTSGIGVNVRSSTGVGVWVETTTSPALTAASTDLTGVSGFSTKGIGVRGNSMNHYGVQAVGVIGITAKGSSAAGFFDGDVNVTGTLFKGGVAFRIDHPLDPENRYLAHSSVESPEMKNLYDGVVTLDDDGQATVELPAWFEALNETFRYQLTPIGAPGPNLHVSRQLADNRFTIAGGDPRMEVCWQVTGVRRDAWALAHPLVVEEDKAPEERGYYLHPQEHRQSADRDLFSVQHAGSSRLPDRPDEA